MKNKDFWVIFNKALPFILFGIIFIFISFLPHLEGTGFSLLREIVISFFSHIGIGLLILGFVTIMIESEHWTVYFEKRLSKIVVDKEYLQKLTEVELTILQTEVLKAYFKNDQIGGTDGFLQHYQNNIQSFIGQPFRTSVIFTLDIKSLPSDNSKLKVDEYLQFTCMKNGNKCQEFIEYIPDEGEYEHIENIEVSIQHESFKNEDNPEGKKKYSMENLSQMDALLPKNLGFKFSIADYNLDKLNVVIKLTFIVSREKLISWRMSQPTKGVNIIVHYPKDLNLFREMFFSSSLDFNEENNRDNNRYTFLLQDWLMPNEGITFQLTS